MKKILFISDMLCQKNIGASALSYTHLNSLKKINNIEVDVISLNGKNNIIIQDVENINSYKSKLGLLNNLIQLNTPFINNSIINYIIEKINNIRYDYIFIDNSYFGKLVYKIKKNTNAKVITFYHDIKRNLCLQLLKEKGMSYLPFYIGYIYNEGVNAKYTDYNITLNTRESNMLNKYYGISTDYELPIVINDFYQEGKHVKSLSKKILFVGAYYAPNNNGLIWFIDNVIPNIKEDIELQVVGKNMEKIKDEVNSNKVNIIGSVDDLSAYYKESDFVIEPIFQGAGMKVKTAEAMMFGKVILGTEEALEGYKNEINNRKLMVFECNTADEFSKTINDIYDGKIKIEKFNKDIRENYIENYSQESAKKMLENILFNKKEK
ncbi:glycosyltransferase [Clostridium sp. 2218st1_F5_2218SCRN_220325]|uniref:glycosyltransferase n=1 Tax=Clostridium sp. 2218st1_F5_2218SCRN_220325 TaxID=3143056 RepID=UPI00319D9C6A